MHPKLWKKSKKLYWGPSNEDRLRFWPVSAFFYISGFDLSATSIFVKLHSLIHFSLFCFNLVALFSPFQSFIVKVSDSSCIGRHFNVFTTLFSSYSRCWCCIYYIKFLNNSNILCLLGKLICQRVICNFTIGPSILGTS